MSKARKLADLLDSAGDVAGGKIADDTINSEHFVDGGIDDAHIDDVAATKLTGTIADARFPATLPAKSAANLTNIPAANITGTLPAINGASLTNVVAASGVATDATKLPLAGGTMTGDVTLEAITETKTTKSASFTPDLTNDGTLYSCTGTMTITMPSAEAGKSFTIIHATATSITWSGTIEWNGGSEPTKGSGIDIYVFISDGTNWYANQAGTGYA